MKCSYGRSAVLVLALHIPTAVADEPARLRGDPHAVELIAKLQEQLGGARAWADAHTLYVDYRRWRTDPGDSIQ